MENFLYVALCFALVALGLSIGVIINHSQKSTFENYFSAVLAEMMEINRRVERLSSDIETLKTDVYESTVPMSTEVYDDDDTSGFVTAEIPSVDNEGWEWR